MWTISHRRPSSCAYSFQSSVTCTPYELVSSLLSVLPLPQLATITFVMFFDRVIHEDPNLRPHLQKWQGLYQQALNQVNMMELQQGSVTDENCDPGGDGTPSDNEDLGGGGCGGDVSDGESGGESDDENDSNNDNDGGVTAAVLESPNEAVVKDNRPQLPDKGFLCFCAQSTVDAVRTEHARLMSAPCAGGTTYVCRQPFLIVILLCHTGVSSIPKYRGTFGLTTVG